MIKLITFDFYNTLVKFWPPLEEIQQGACRKLGLSIPQDALRRGYAQADILFNRANEQEPLSLRSPQRRLEFFAEYEQLILATAGVPVTRDLAKQIWQLAIAVPKEFAPFPDTLPTLRTLREQGYRLGIITNLRADLPSLIQRAGLADILEFCITPPQVPPPPHGQPGGVEKPHPAIFREALRRAALTPQEVLHIGDQIRSDVAGARAIGMQAALLDRGNWHQPIPGFPKITTLYELPQLLKSQPPCQPPTPPIQ